MHLLFLSFKFIAKVYYTVYINISHSTEEDTPPNTKQLSFPCLCGGDQLQVWTGVPLGGICNLIRVFFVILAYPCGILFSPLSVYQFVCWHLEYVCLPVEELGNCLVNHATVLLSVALYTQLSRWIFWLLNLRTITLTMLASRRPNSFLGLDT